MSRRRHAFDLLSLLGGRRGATMCKFQIVETSANATIKACTYVQADTSSAAITLAAPSSAREGAEFAAKNVGAALHNVTVTGVTGRGSVLADGEASAWRFDGAAWELIAYSEQQPTLQPLSGAWGAWTLEGGSDRSGGGHGVQVPQVGVGGYAQRVAARVQGNTTIWGNGTKDGTSPGGYQIPNVDLAAFVSTGLTLTFWALWGGKVFTGYPETWALSWASNNASWLPWIVQLTSPTPGRVAFYDGTTGRLTSLQMALGAWQFCAVSIAPGGAAIVGLDGVYEAFTGVQIQKPETQTTLTILSQPYATNFQRNYGGALWDLALWNRALTQNELEQQRLKSWAVPT